MNKQLLFDMLRTPSVSGNEFALQQKLYDYMKDKVDDMRSDDCGNVIGVLNPESKMKVLLAGHIDEIGLMVSGITSDGFLKVRNIGGIYPTTYLGHKVRVHTDQGVIFGAVVNSRQYSSQKEFDASMIQIDIGASIYEEAHKAVRIGDCITFDTDCCELLNDKLCGRALDNRIGAFIVMETLLRCKELGCSIGVYGASTVGEETTKRGAYMAAANVNPTIAIAVDVTYASDYPSATNDRNVILGKGPVICYAPLIHRTLNERLLECAKQHGLEVQIETEAARTGTDADTIFFTGNGVPVCLVSIPLRYMHNPNETASLRDIQTSIELLSQFLCGLTESCCNSSLVTY